MSVHVSSYQSSVWGWCASTFGWTCDNDKDKTFWRVTCPRVAGRMGHRTLLGGYSMHRQSALQIARYSLSGAISLRNALASLANCRAKGCDCSYIQENLAPANIGKSKMVVLLFSRHFLVIQIVILDLHCHLIGILLSFYWCISWWSCFVILVWLRRWQKNVTPNLGSAKNMNNNESQSGKCKRYVKNMQNMQTRTFQVGSGSGHPRRMSKREKNEEKMTHIYNNKYSTTLFIMLEFWNSSSAIFSASFYLTALVSAQVHKFHKPSQDKKQQSTGPSYTLLPNDS